MIITGLPSFLSFSARPHHYHIIQQLITEYFNLKMMKYYNWHRHYNRFIRYDQCGSAARGKERERESVSVQHVIESIRHHFSKREITARCCVVTLLLLLLLSKMVISSRDLCVCAVLLQSLARQQLVIIHRPFSLEKGEPNKLNIINF